MPPRQRLHLVGADEDHRVSTLELFFDLVFVYAITQTTQLMADHLSPLGVAQGLMVLAVLWWCWCSYAWLGTTIHVDQGVARLAMFGAMAVMFLVSLTVPEAFTGPPGGLDAPLLFVGCYAVVRLLHEVAYLGAARHDPELRRVLLRMLRGLVPSIALLAVATFLHGPWQLVVWAVALFADYLNVYLSGPAGWRLNSPAHFAERFGLIVIIALGESIVAIGIGIGELPMTWLVAGSAICGIALAAGMWWTYFDVVAHAAEHRLTRATGLERAKIATDSYTFLHLPLIAGVVLVALGLKKSFLYLADTVHYGPGVPLHGVPLWALTGGLALYLVAVSSLRRRNLGSWNRQRLVLAVVLLALTPLLAHVPAAVLVLIVAATVLALIAFERTPWARRPVSVPRAGR
ncbi:low temperature requirement protein A [Amycolatopsis saalfeldensis]|uniref:Low temperature requirement protein LtrA n=1 Tax=Amycolatopsis saalfeldensis TaxID=394193 RepID=A0A1H8QVI1_9PSEU|nr:low temperature requirement protein A [Amycolatopsis saalfeldensis]SEO58067.1 Low temperature requirement protein LtrA [Amycolatopsis saalfeldensis]